MGALQSAPFCGARKDTPKGSTGDSIWINDLVSQVRTGDVLLTSNKDGGAKFIKTFTGTKWNHVGIIIKPSPNRAYLVEWGGGLFACELEERMQEYAEYDTLDLVVRHLVIQDVANRPKIEERIEKFVDMMFREKLGQNRGIPLGKILKAASSMISSSNSYSKDEVVDDLNELFCSKTVAVCYKAAGVVGANRHADSFIPKHFAYRYNDFLDMQGGANLGPEHRVTFESKRLKDAVTNVLHMPVIELLAYGTSHKSEEKAALLIEKFVRRIAARKEAARRKKYGKKDKDGDLFRGAENHSTKSRMALLKEVAGMPHKKPQDTLQVTWVDPDEAHEVGTSRKEMLI